MENELKGGIVIIGSLYWQDDKEYGNGDGVRKIWRDKYLEMDKVIKVKFPNRYHRISKGKETTMGVSKSAIDSGIAYFVPFVRNSSFCNFPELDAVCNAIRVVEAEDLGHIYNTNFLKGMSKTSDESFLAKFYLQTSSNEKFVERPRISKEWVITSIGLNKSKENEKKQVFNIIRDGWSKNCVKTNLRTTYYNSERIPFYSVPEDGYYQVKEVEVGTEKEKQKFKCDEEGKLIVGEKESKINENEKKYLKNNREKITNRILDDIPIAFGGIFDGLGEKDWLEAIDESEQKKLNTFDYFLTCVLPPSLQPKDNSYEIAKVDLDYDKKRFYFFNNLACGIRTKDDFTTILKNKLEVEAILFNDKELKLNDGEYIDKNISRYSYDGDVKYEFLGIRRYRIAFCKGNLYFIDRDSKKIYWKTTNKCISDVGYIISNNGYLEIHSKCNEKILWSSNYSIPDNNCMGYDSDNKVGINNNSIYSKPSSTNILYLEEHVIKTYNSNELLLNDCYYNSKSVGNIKGNLNETHRKFEFDPQETINLLDIGDKQELALKELTLKQGEFYQCGNNKLIFDTKGRLLIYKGDKLVWFSKKSNTNKRIERIETGYEGKVAVFQYRDGNFVIYNNNNDNHLSTNAVWSSGPLKEQDGPYSFELTEGAEIIIKNFKGENVKSLDNEEAFKHFPMTAQMQYVKYTDKERFQAAIHDPSNDVTKPQSESIIEIHKKAKNYINSKTENNKKIDDSIKSGLKELLIQNFESHELDNYLTQHDISLDKLTEILIAEHNQQQDL